MSDSEEPTDEQRLAMVEALNTWPHETEPMDLIQSAVATKAFRRLSDALPTDRKIDVAVLLQLGVVGCKARELTLEQVQAYVASIWNNPMVTRAMARGLEERRKGAH